MSFGKLAERFCYLLQRDVGGAWASEQPMLGHVAEVAMCAITFPEVGGVGTGDFGDHFRELRPAYAQDAFIEMRKRAATQENRRADGIFERQRFKKFAYKSDFGSFFGGCGYGFARLHEPAHGLKRLRASTPWAGNAGTRRKCAHQTLVCGKRSRCRNDGRARRFACKPTTVPRRLHGRWCAAWERRS